jgi:hypothetical protein
MIDGGDYGEIGGMKIGRGNRCTGRKPAPVPLCPPQIPHNQTRARTRAVACPVFLWPLLEIHAELGKKIVILGIQRLQKLQLVFFCAKKLDL